ncbi:DUF4349 domain-containing protein [Dictyobacter formicarum]|uniref:DUF4349 domain-containing protein n=1 Tax=Dictyobacter formicarum TaxID=2778368 RepID=A0ABQ3VEV3_9CHLR|nr:DUF4349 domain-containing protein [Dictyobacter formicarum]GHO83671.1 hypothetical protein KSZ_16770 [Dictyobacter formicarum]
MLRTWVSHQKLLLFACVMLLALWLAACGSAGSATSNTSSSMPTAQRPADHSANNASGSSSTNSGSSSTSAQKNKSGNSQSSSADAGPQYLIKTLNVTMQVKDTRKVASDIQSWIATTDPRSSSAGADYTQVGDKYYNVSLTFSVQATLYPQIYSYLRDYNVQGSTGGKLVGFKETVQDVSNDYVDTQSRIKNYKGEQARLLTLLSQAQAVSDIVTIDQKLSEVEGNIETAEAHLKLLSSQVTFYTVNLYLQPIIPNIPDPAPQTNTDWSFSGSFGEAFTASLSFGRALLTFLIWLLAFSIYVVPVVLVAWLIRKYRVAIGRIVSPLLATYKPPLPPQPHT